MEEGLGGVEGEVGVGEPGGAVVGFLAEVLLGCGQGAQAWPVFVAGGVAAGQSELQEAAGGGVGGAGEGVGQELLGEGVVALPCCLSGEVADEAGAAVGVAGGVGVVEGGDPVLGGMGVVAVVEAAPGDGVGDVAASVFRRFWVAVVWWPVLRRSVTVARCSRRSQVVRG
ncbi:hypothetical protein AB0K93_13270 [Streptomyces sp. NPDC052676]|uniref:hypothetical protein n=1 Tax=Streptomyces sp. NPDC052676 TaxID=3154953 RepID=UPI0034281D78